jgi:hypothetical protein
MQRRRTGDGPDLANVVLTTIMETWGQTWTMRSSVRALRQLRHALVDALGPAKPPENRSLNSSPPHSSDERPHISLFLVASNLRLINIRTARRNSDVVQEALVRKANGGQERPKRPHLRGLATI